MRLVSFAIAALVIVTLYFVIFDREALLDFAGAGNAAPLAADEAEDEAADGEAGAAPGEAVPVFVRDSTAREIDSGVVLRGRTEAARQVEVRSETTSTVTSQPLRKGSRVEAGQVLCELAPGTRQAALAEAEARLPEAQARLASARASVAEAEINLNAASKLSEGGFASETRLKSAEAAAETARAGVESALAAVQSAEAGVESARSEIDKLVIKAPFAGLLETDTAELGAFLQAGGLCATVIQLDPVKLVGFVSEADVDRVEVGARAGARLVSGREVQGEVTFLSRSADPATRTFRVEVELPNPDLSIRDGQTVEMVIAAEGRAAHLLPQSALTLDDDGAIGVRLMNDDKLAEFAPVQVIRDTREGVWVSGLPDEVTVITIGQEYVVDGVPVAPTWQEARSE